MVTTVSLAKVSQEICQSDFMVFPAGKIRPPTRSVKSQSDYFKLAAHGLQFIKKRQEECSKLLGALAKFSCRLLQKIASQQERKPPIVAFLSWKNKIGMILPLTPGKVVLQVRVFTDPNSQWTTIKEVSNFAPDSKYPGYFFTEEKVRIEDLNIQEIQVPMFRFLWTDDSTGEEKESCWFIQINGGVSYASALVKYFTNLEASFPTLLREEIPADLYPFTGQDSKKRQRSPSSDPSDEELDNASKKQRTTITSLPISLFAVLATVTGSGIPPIPIGYPTLYAPEGLPISPIFDPMSIGANYTSEENPGTEGLQDNVVPFGELQEFDYPSTSAQEIPLIEENQGTSSFDEFLCQVTSK